MATLIATLRLGKRNAETQALTARFPGPEHELPEHELPEHELSGHELSELQEPLARALEDLSNNLMARGCPEAEAWDIAGKSLLVLGRNPAGAVQYLRALDPQLWVPVPSDQAPDRSTDTGPSDVRTPRSRALTGPVPVPAWSWLYLLGLMLAVPTWVTDLHDRYDGYTSLAEQPHVTDMVVLLIVPWAVPMLFLLAGLFGVLLPGVRRRWIERRYHLTVRPAGEALAIQDFVHEHAPGVEVVLSGDGGRYARIYPQGLRRARLGVFAPLIRLWSTDRAAAEAVLLHELAHRRQGEHLLLGLGSPLQALLKVWTAVFLIFTVVPVAGLLVADGLLFESFVAQVIVDATGPLRILILPVAAIWWAEFAADAWAARLYGPGAVLVALQAERTGSARRRFLGLVDHPPVRLRRALLIRRPSSVLFLAAWPLLPLLQLAVILAGALPAWKLLGASPEDLLELAAHNSHHYLVNALWVTVGGTVMLLTWALRTLRSGVDGRPLGDSVIGAGAGAGGTAGNNRWGGQRNSARHLSARYLLAALFPLALASSAAVAVPVDEPEFPLPTPTTEASPYSSPSPSVPVMSPTPSNTPSRSPSPPPPVSPSSTPSSTRTAPSPSPEKPEATASSGKSNPTVAGQELPVSYEVTLSGAAGGNSFERTAQLEIRPTITRVGVTNDLNAVDVCLISGLPAGRPEAGAIWYSSNSNCRPSNTGAAMDLGYVTVDGDTITVSPDERIAATLSNNFTTSNDYIYAGLYAPVDGSLRITLGADGTVSGTLNLTGYGGAGYGNAAYEARITGRRS